MNTRILNEPLLDKTLELAASLDAGVFFVHSDILKGFNLRTEPFSTQNLLQAHFDVIKKITKPADLWFPVFNLTWPKSQHYDIKLTPSEMGHLSEYFRQHVAGWHSGIPMHGVCGTGPKPFQGTHEILDPWAADSLFRELMERNGYLYFYGAGFESVSLIHFVEKQMQLPYRYEKIFNGTLISEKATEQKVSVAHIVRPMNFDIEYDWVKIKTDLEGQGLWLESSDTRTKNVFISARGLFDFWCTKAGEDPFYFITEIAKQQILPLYQKLQRPFIQSDFEN